MKRRNTDTKNEIHALLKKANSALSHDMIKEKMLTSVDRATIYRILNRLCEDKIVHKIIADDGKQYFAFCVNCQEHNHNHNHFHFRCTKCGTVECLESELKIGLPKNYVFENLNGVISGTCPTCKKNTTPS